MREYVYTQNEFFVVACIMFHYKSGHFYSKILSHRLSESRNFILQHCVKV